MKYNLKITITRNDLPDTELTIDLVDCGGKAIRDTNPAIGSLLTAFDLYVAAGLHSQKVTI